ncbi:MAG: hypothetical protein D6796_02550 [Caldilineae bacterium]|nr:MAG: hypothetical protein D6796_02550 [Caldilineae bacterium]
MSSQSISFRPATVIRQLPWSLDKKAALGLLLLLLTFSLVGWLYLGQASFITSSTLRVDELRQEIDLLKQANNDLSLEIAELEAITRVQERARALGFAPTPPENIRYLAVEDYPATIAPDIPPPPAAGDRPSLWQRWMESVTAWLTGDGE